MLAAEPGSAAEHERAEALETADEEGRTALELAGSSDGDSEGREACVAALEAALAAAARAEELRLAQGDCWEELFGASAAANVECHLAVLAAGAGTIAVDSEACAGVAKGEGGGEGGREIGHELLDQEAAERPMPKTMLSASPAPPEEKSAPLLPTSVIGSIRYPKRRRVQAGAWWMSAVTKFERDQVIKRGT